MLKFAIFLRFIFEITNVHTLEKSVIVAPGPIVVLVLYNPLLSNRKFKVFIVKI